MSCTNNSQLLLDKTILNLVRKNTMNKEMTKSFSTLHGVFCLEWKEKEQSYNIWSFGIEPLLKLFFKINKRQQLLYFPQPNKMMIVFRRER